jgi:hypothetical protein
MTEEQHKELVEAIARCMQEWEELSVDKDYEIRTRYPYYIRKKGTTEYLREVPNGDYHVYNFNGHVYLKHRLIAQQWIQNPLNLPQVHHRNGDTHDNRLTNLMWVTAKVNNRNKFKYADRNIVYLDKLPEGPIKVQFYSKWIFDDLWYSNGYFYNYSGLAYRQLPKYELPSGAFITEACDIHDKNHLIYYSKFFRLYNIGNDGAQEE